MRTTFKPFLWLSSLILIVSLACNASQSTPAPTEPPPPPPTNEPVVIEKTEEPVVEPTREVQTEPEPSGGVASLGDVELAVIQIEAEGTFIDPEVGWQVGAGKLGSGFIIDPSGIAVTNNHVVTGAGLLRVYITGETRPRNARVLGVSECSDLAVIDIDGDGFPYLEWYDQPLTVGLKVYAAGFPLGDPNYTLTDGIISKAEADGETSWASVDSVIEHTAKINPGNSGGPLVTEDGKLLGVNYAVVSSTDQNFTIARDEAIPVIDELTAGKNVDSIGINGGAVYGEIEGLPIYGVWVRSVASGSPADKARVEPGDIIWEMEGNPLAEDGTMADYCDVLRSHRPSDTMSLTVIRFSEVDMPILEGQLNGRELELTGMVFGTGSSSDDPDTPPAGDIIELTDETGTLYVQVPGSWGEYNPSAWIFDGEDIGVGLTAAPSVDDYWGYYQAPGVFFGASPEWAKYGGYVQILDYYSGKFGDTGFNYRGNCDLDGEYNYDDGLYKGRMEIYYNCGGAGGYDTYLLSAKSTDSYAYVIVLAIQVPKGDEDTPALILNSFLVGDL